MPNEQMSTLTAGGVTYEIVDKVARAGGPQAKIVFLHQDDSECDTPAYGFGSCTVIHNDNTCIVYDFGADTSKRLLEYLVDNQIKKVDTVIASHYHADHCSLESINAFISGCSTNGIDLTNCTFYLPHGNIDWTKYTGSSKTTLQTREENVISKILQSGFIYIQPAVEGQHFISGDIKIEFFNIDSTLYETTSNNYYTWMYNENNAVSTDTNYNNFSMCALLTIGRYKLLLTGDIMHPAQEVLAHIVKQADCIMVPHHGLNCRESNLFIDNMSCRYGVVPTYWSNKVTVIDEGLRPITARCRELGTVLCTLDEDVVFTVNEEGFKLANETTREIKGKPSGQKLYRGEDLNTIGLGTFYTDSAAESGYISNWPEIDGIRLGACKIESIPSGGYDGILQIARETYMSRMYTASRKKENGNFSPWKFGTLLSEENSLMLTQRKNLLPNVTRSTVINGITFTLNIDGSVTVNGTSTSAIEYYLSRRTANHCYLPKGTFILSGCPSGGSASTYRIGYNRGSSGTTLGNDTGNGVTITNPEGAYFGVWIGIASGLTFDNAVFKPMIRPSFLNDEFVAYGSSNAELSQNKIYIPTYTENDYVDQSAVARLTLQRFGRHGVLKFNCNVGKADVPSSGGTIAQYKIAEYGVTLLQSSYATIPAQNGESAPLTVEFSDTGNLYIMNYVTNQATASGWYRAAIPVIFAEN